MEKAKLNQLIEYPLWRLALDNILNRIEKTGLGVFFSHDELKGWMGLTEPTTIQEAKQHSFDYLNGLDRLKKDLLYNHLVYLDNSRGKGYIAVVPDDQVDRIPENHITKAKRELNKAYDALTNVQTDLLSMEASYIRANKMSKIAFLKNAHKKRFSVKVDEPKQIDTV